MASVLDLARLSAEVYHDRPDLRGWETVQCFSTREPSVLGIRVRRGGFFACLFRQRSSQEYVLAVRGTDDPGPDVRDDLLIAIGAVAHFTGNVLGTAASITPQFWEAQSCIPAVGAHTRRKEFYLTGHSLGGGIAVLLAAMNRLPVVTFNAPGIAFLGTTFGRNLYWWRRDDRRMLHVRSRHDPVSLLSPRNPGGQRLVAVPCTTGGDQSLLQRAGSYLLCQHSIAELRDAIERFEPDLKQDLGWLNN